MGTTSTPSRRASFMNPFRIDRYILSSQRDFGGASLPSPPSNNILHFVRAIECYLEDYDEEFRREVFTFIENESTYLRSGNGDALRNALRAKLPHLIQFDVTKSALMIADLYMIDSLSSEFAENKL